MDFVLEWIGGNYKWLFSGIGAVLIGGFFFTKGKSVDKNKVIQHKIISDGDVAGRDIKKK